MSEQPASRGPSGLDELSSVIAEHALGPYLLTVTEDNRPHVGDVTYRWNDGEVLVPAPSSWARSEQLGHLDVSLLWPPNEPGGYSLIVDGRGHAVTSGLAISVSRAVHYRPATSPDGEPCGADCVPIFPNDEVLRRQA